MSLRKKVPLDFEKELQKEDPRGLALAKACLVQWASNTCCNGIPNIERAASIIRKLIWTLLVLGGTGATIAQVTIAVLYHFTYPVNVVVNITHKAQIDFPAITICNVNPARKSKLNLGKAFLVDIIPGAIGVGNSTDIESANRFGIKAKFQQAFQLIDPATREMMGHQKEDMIVGCEYNGERCGPGNFERVSSPTYGNCYVFNSGWDGTSVKTAHKAGPEYGLSVELFIEQSEYVADLTELAGARVTIHPQKHMPFPDDDGYFLAPGYLTSIGVKMLNITRLPSPFPSACWDMDRNQAKEHNSYAEIYNISYSLLACKKSCYQSHVIKDCDCGDFLLPMEGKAVLKYARNATTTYVKPCRTNIEVQCELDVKTKYLADQLSCNCSSACTEIDYVGIPSMAAWPNMQYMGQYYKELSQKSSTLSEIVYGDNNGTQASPGSNLLKLQVFFDQLNYDLVLEEEAYGVGTLMADIGGLVGFWLGLSVVALFEFFELFVDLAFICCMGVFRRLGPSRPIRRTPIEPLHSDNKLT